MAESKKKSKAKGKNVDAIIIVVIAILILAMIALGIVLAISLNTPDTIKPEEDKALVTNTSSSYSDYLKTTMDSVGYKELPISSINSSSSYTSVVLGTDNSIYLIGSGETEVPGGENVVGTKVAIENVVDIFGVEAGDIYSIYAITDDGKIYTISYTDGTTIEYTNEAVKNPVEIFEQNSQTIIRLYDETTVSMY